MTNIEITDGQATRIVERYVGRVTDRLVGGKITSKDIAMELRNTAIKKSGAEGYVRREKKNMGLSEEEMRTLIEEELALVKMVISYLNSL